jgi:dTDP-4-dehydrorhamnose 3,5-epimerase
MEAVASVHGAYMVRPRVFRDARGFFQEVFNSTTYPRVTHSSDGPAQAPVMRQFSLSCSRLNTVRGIHCAPYGKLVQCTAGRVFDVIVDLRVASPTFGKWFGTWLSAEGHEQVYVPPRCGHGFLAVQDNSVLTYCQEGTYVLGADVELNPLDPEIAIAWPPPVPLTGRWVGGGCTGGTSQDETVRKSWSEVGAVRIVYFGLA